MRKKLLTAAWLLLPVVLLAYHYGPGQRGLSRDQAARAVAAARQAESTEDWANAVLHYADALAAWPDGDPAQRVRLRLAQANARLMSGELPEAKAELEGLLADAQRSNLGPALVAEARAGAASAQYYAGWLMRVEGAATDEWMAETESARQHFRLLAEQSAGGELAGAGPAADYQRNLEAVVRLQRMDLSELKGLPLPKQCKNCSNCSSKCRQQRASACKNPGDGKGQGEDAREKIAKEKKSGAGKSSRSGTGS